MLPAPLLGIKGMIELAAFHAKMCACAGVRYRRIADAALRAMPGLSD